MLSGCCIWIFTGWFSPMLTGDVSSVADRKVCFFVLFNGAISGFHINCMNYMYTLAKICSGLLHTTVQLADNYISKTKPGK